MSDRHNLHRIVQRFAIERSKQACLDIAAIAAEAFPKLLLPLTPHRTN
jgi:hypothetical protein